MPIVVVGDILCNFFQEASAHTVANSFQGKVANAFLKTLYKLPDDVID